MADNCSRQPQTDRTYRKVLACMLTTRLFLPSLMNTMLAALGREIEDDRAFAEHARFFSPAGH